MATTSPFDNDQYEKLSTGAQISPVTQAFDEGNSTAGRVNSIINSGSPLMKTAATRAAQAMQGRGLRNSSLAVQAGQQAVIETATPMAQTDANLFQQQALANQNAKNTANQFNANTKTTVGLAGLDAGQQESQFGRSLMEQARQFNGTNSLEQQKLAQSGDQFTQNLQLQRDTLNSSTGLEQAKLTEGARQFDTSSATSAQQFAQELQAQRDQFNQNLTLQREQLGVTSDADKARLAETVRQFDAQSVQQQQQFVQNLGLQREQLVAQKDQFAQQYGLDAQQLDMQRGQLSQQQQQFLAELDLKDRQLSAQASQAEAQLANQRTIAQMDADNRLALADVEASYKSDISGNENISNAWGTMMSSINDIQNNPELDEAARKTAIENQISSFQAFTGFWKKATGGAVDVSDLLQFSVVGGQAAAPENIFRPGAGSGVRDEYEGQLAPS